MIPYIVILTALLLQIFSFYVIVNYFHPFNDDYNNIKIYYAFVLFQLFINALYLLINIIKYYKKKIIDDADLTLLLNNLLPCSLSIYFIFYCNMNYYDKLKIIGFMYGMCIVMYTIMLVINKIQQSEIQLSEIEQLENIQPSCPLEPTLPQEPNEIV